MLHLKKYKTRTKSVVKKCYIVTWETFKDVWNWTAGKQFKLLEYRNQILHHYSLLLHQNDEYCFSSFIYFFHCQSKTSTVILSPVYFQKVTTLWDFFPSHDSLHKTVNKPCAMFSFLSFNATDQHASLTVVAIKTWLLLVSQPRSRVANLSGLK